MYGFDPEIEKLLQTAVLAVGFLVIIVVATKPLIRNERPPRRPVDSRSARQ